MTDRVTDDVVLDRVLAFDAPPGLSAGFADRLIAEAQRADRPRLPAAGARRSAGRRWTRRGIVTTVVAINLVLASAVAAAISGGAISVAKIADVAHRIVAHIHSPPHHVVSRTHHLSRPAPVGRRHEMSRPAPAIPPRMLARPMQGFARPPIMQRRVAHAGMRPERARQLHRAIARAHPHLAHRPMGSRPHPLRAGGRGMHAHPNLVRPGGRQGPQAQGWRNGAGQGLAPWRGGNDGRGWRAPFRERQFGEGGFRPNRFGQGWRDRRGGGWGGRGGRGMGPRRRF